MALDEATRQMLIDVGLTLGLGALIGLERERHRKEKLILAGVRTYPLVALLGLLSAALGQEFDMPLLVALSALVVGTFAIFMYYVRQGHGNAGLTSPMALYATFFVGVLVGNGRTFEAIVVGLAIALLLFTKERLHRVADVMSPQEMEGALYFLVMALVLYPILPEEPIDPWHLLRLRTALLVVLLVSLISFLSFLAIRRYGGAHGLPFSGFLGGLVNSEATTVSLANLQRRKPSLHNAAYVGILLSTGTLFVRNLVIAGIADPSLRLVLDTLVPMLGVALVYFAWSLLRAPEATDSSTTITLESPFAFRPAFWFALWFTLVSVVTFGVMQIPSLGEKGVYVAAIGGIVSAGAVVASMGTLLAADKVTLELASQTAVLASLLSAANKIVLARVGGSKLSNRLLWPSAMGIGVGLLLLLVWGLLRESFV